MSSDEPMTLVEELESTIRGRMLMAKARYESALEAFNEAVTEGRDVDAQIARRPRTAAFERARIERLRRQRDAAQQQHEQVAAALLKGAEITLMGRRARIHVEWLDGASR